VADLRRAFRTLRDRAARADGRWASVAVAGLLHGAEARLAVMHPELSAEAVEARLRGRWPVLAWIPGAAPDLPAPPLDETLLVALALRRRGAEPLRIVVAAKRAVCDSAKPPAFPDPWAEPMPLTF